MKISEYLSQSSNRFTSASVPYLFNPTCQSTKSPISQKGNGQSKTKNEESMKNKINKKRRRRKRQSKRA
jgi:hypothetical protein